MSLSLPFDCERINELICVEYCCWRLAFSFWLLAVSGWQFAEVKLFTNQLIKLNMRNFRTLNIWKEGILLVKEIYEMAALLPVDEKYGLKSQICRAAVSVPSNIAEGASRNSEIEYKRFLEIAMGSLFELETQLIIIDEVKLIHMKNFSSIFELITKEEKMINNLISKLKANSPKPRARY